MRNTERNKEPSSPVSETKAMEHAIFAMRSNWAMGVKGFDGWGAADLEKKPLVIHDLNGQILFYEYEVVENNMPVGSIKTSASKTIGSPVLQIQIIPRRWDPEYALKKAKEEVKKHYPGARIKETEFVCYSYPKIGVRVFIEDPKTDTNSLIFDVADLSLVERFGSDELEGFTSWSFYDEIVEPDAARREARWELADLELEAAKTQIPVMFKGGFAARESKDIQKDLNKAYAAEKPSIMVKPITSQKVIQYCPHCTTHDCNALHAQQTDVYCAVATGQMILDFYRYYYSQNEIATAMGTGPGGTSNEGQVNGYRQLSNNCLDGFIDLTATWAEAKAEIDANRPLKSGIAGHARACFGWKKQNFIIKGTKPKNWLYILDPWPWNADMCKGGAVYWEDWEAINHTNFIYVRHRTTPCK